MLAGHEWFDLGPMKAFDLCREGEVHGSVFCCFPEVLCIAERERCAMTTKDLGDDA